MPKPLTAVAVAKLRPGRYKDRQEGLVLLVHPTGRRVFQFRARGADGKPKKVVLGAFNPGRDLSEEPIVGQALTLAGARHLAARLWRERALGTNVFARPEREPAGRTFGAVAREFVEQHAKRTTRRWRETAALLGIGPEDKIVPGSLAARWRDTPLAAIDGDMLHQVIEEATESGVPGRRVRTRKPSSARGRGLGRALSTLFGWALRQKRYLRANPVAGVHIPGAGAPRERALSADEIKTLWPALDAAGNLPARVLRMLLLTGQRLNEIRCMRWDEIVDERGEWTLLLPKERTKSKRAHKIPLSALAREIIENAPRIAGSPFVFSLDGEAAVSLGTKQKRAVDKQARIAPWVVHDLRRTAETHMAEMGISGDVRDAILNHAKPGMRRVYDRSERLPERRAALESWARRVAAIVTGEESSNVVALRTPAGT